MPSFTKTIDCLHNIRASLDEQGNFVLRARSRLAYAPDDAPEAFVAAEVEIPPEYAARVQEALEVALAAVSEQLAAKVDRAAAVALDAARGSGDFDDPEEFISLARKVGVEVAHRSAVVQEKLRQMLLGEKS